MGMMYGDGEGTVWDRVGRPRRDCMCYLGPPTTLMPIGMRKSPDVSPRRLSDISPQLRQLKYLVVDESIKEDLKSSRSVEDINSASIEERILRITGYYGYQPWKSVYNKRSERLPCGTVSDLSSFYLNITPVRCVGAAVTPQLYSPTLTSVTCSSGSEYYNSQKSLGEYVTAALPSTTSRRSPSPEFESVTPVLNLGS